MVICFILIQAQLNAHEIIDILLHWALVAFCITYHVSVAVSVKVCRRSYLLGLSSELLEGLEEVLVGSG